MQYGFQRQAIRLRRILIGPSERYGSYRHDKFRQLQSIDNHLRHIHRRAEETRTQSLLLGDVAERLAVEQCVGCGIHERQEVVVARRSVAVFRPNSGAAEVGAEGKHHRCALYHRLVEVRWGEFLLHFLAARNDNGIQLQVSHCLCALRLFEQSVEQVVGNILCGIFPYGFSFFQ